MNRIDYSYVNVIQQSLGIRERLTVEWVGEYPIARLSYSVIRYFLKSERDEVKPGDSIKLEHLRLTVLAYDFVSQSYLVVEQDDARAYVAYAFDRLGYYLIQLKWRFILTLAVWGLAECRGEREPQWKDVKLFKPD